MLLWGLVVLASLLVVYVGEGDLKLIRQPSDIFFLQFSDRTDFLGDRLFSLVLFLFRNKGDTRDRGLPAVRGLYNKLETCYIDPCKLNKLKNSLEQERK